MHETPLCSAARRCAGQTCAQCCGAHAAQQQSHAQAGTRSPSSAGTGQRLAAPLQRARRPQSTAGCDAVHASKRSHDTTNKQINPQKKKKKKKKKKSPHSNNKNANKITSTSCTRPNARAAYPSSQNGNHTTAPTRVCNSRLHWGTAAPGAAS